MALVLEGAALTAGAAERKLPSPDGSAALQASGGVLFLKRNVCDLTACAREMTPANAVRLPRCRNGKP